MTYAIQRTIPDRYFDLYVSKMKGSKAVGTTNNAAHRLEYKTLAGAIRAMRRLYLHGLISDEWYVSETYTGGSEAPRKWTVRAHSIDPR